MNNLPKHFEHRSPTRAEILALKKELENIDKSKTDHKVFVGFDGFIDNIQKAVKKKKGDNNILFSTIADFSKHIGGLAGRSGQIELVTSQTKAGGNAPILAQALSELNVKIFCIGAMGLPTINPLFQNVAATTQLLSVAEPGKSQAIEFTDGKLILSDLSGFVGYDWNYIKKTVDVEKIREAVRSSDLVALVDWSNLPSAIDIWQGLLDDVIKVINSKELCFLFDICDPSRKDAIEVDEMLDLISSFSHYGKVTLALNENEAVKIWMALHGYEQGDRYDPPSLVDIGAFINYTITANTILIHPIDRTLAFQEHKIIELMGRLVKEPKVQTGGGDNFNAGYCLGLLHQLSIDKCMLLGIATAGAYVQNGKSARISDLVNYLDRWATEIELSQRPSTLVASAG